jgi:cysteinyl-tRNA synthetase
VIRLFDTAQGKVVPFQTRSPGKASIYVCGPTVYGPAHVGHGRMTLVFDVLRRYLEWSGLEVTFVSNITDIDDQIINRAAAEAADVGEIAERYEEAWFRAMDAIGVKRPTEVPHATAYVEEMVAFIAGLIETGHAYETSDGVYFSPAAVEDYGLLNHQSIDSLRAGARVEVVEEKRSPIDFALWKKAKPGEPSWPAPWGDGRPGWHTECVVMSLDLLGEGFDLHGGAIDLIFPHHENERAQSVAARRPFAGHWMHNGFVEVDGTKMSKSLGNFTNLLDLIESTDPRAYRLLVLRSHYRTPLEVTKANTDDASTALRRLEGFFRRVATADVPAAAPVAAVLDRFRSAMDDDLDTPAAMSLLFTTVNDANRALDAGDPVSAAALAAAVREISAAVGLVLDVGVQAVPDEVLALVAERDEARAAKDWGRADALRAEIQGLGYAVEDESTGSTVHAL